MKLFSRTCLTLCAAALPIVAAAGPAAADPAGCTATFVAAASDYPSSGESIGNNPKFWLSDGIHLYPQNVAPYVNAVAAHEAAAVDAYVNCL